MEPAGDDGLRYLTETINLVDHGVFSTDRNVVAPNVPKPDAHDLPLWPSTMAVFYKVSHSVRFTQYASGDLVDGDITAQTNQVFENLKAVLEAAGSNLNQVVKTTVFMKDMNDFAAMNEVYAAHFGVHKPARSAVEVARLPKDVQVEIEVIALAK